MPSKNSRKSYLENGYYHIYNRGVEKRNIFQNNQDYGVFLSYMKEYLMPKNNDELLNKLANPDTSLKEKNNILSALRMNNFSGDISLIAYCLMPNHYHLLLHQQSENSIDSFMNSFGSRYSRYFNKRHNRVGTLYQDVYKAVLVESDEQLLHLTRYIHRNPLFIAKKGEVLQGIALEHALMRHPSSYPEYTGSRKTEWVHPEEILSYFSKTNPKLSYSSFVNENEIIDIIQEIALDI